MKTLSPKITSLDAAMAILFQSEGGWRGASEFFRYAAKPMVGLAPGVGDGSDDRMMDALNFVVS